MLGIQGFRLSRDARHPSDESKCEELRALVNGQSGIGPKFG